MVEKAFLCGKGILESIQSFGPTYKILLRRHKKTQRSTNRAGYMQTIIDQATIDKAKQEGISQHLENREKI